MTDDPTLPDDARAGDAQQIARALQPPSLLLPFLGWPFADPPEEPFAATPLTVEILRVVLAFVPVDEAFYLARYPDVAAVVATGAVRNAAHHYLISGFTEGRLPFEIAVDQAYYLAKNQDVKRGVEEGWIPSAQSHFEANGWREGRAPRAGFSLVPPEARSLPAPQ